MPNIEIKIPERAKPGDIFDLNGQLYTVVRVRTGMLGYEPNKPKNSQNDEPKLVYPRIAGSKLDRY